MIEEHLDPTAEAHAHISNLLRTVVTAAAGVAERRAQRRAEEAREAQRLAEVERREIEQRIAAERQTAELIYRRAYRDTWWDHASEGDIAEVVIAAGTWAPSDPRADDALRQVSERLAERYGLDIDLQTLCRGEAGPAGAADTVSERITETTAVRTDARAFEPGVVVMDAAGPALGAALIASEGWPRLAHRLETVAAAGDVDVTGRLRAAIASRELDTAADKALALSWRLKSPPERNSTGHQASRAARHGTPAPGAATGMNPTAKAARQRAIDRGRQPGAGRDGGAEAGR